MKEKEKLIVDPEQLFSPPFKALIKALVIQALDEINDTPEKQVEEKNINDELLTIKQTCEYLKVGRTKLHQDTEERKIISSINIGGRVLYDKAELKAKLHLLKKYKRIPPHLKS